MFPKKGNKLHQPRDGNGQDTSFDTIIAAALKSELGTSHQAVKTVARWTGASERAVKYWFAASHGPSGEHLVAFVRNSDAVWRAVLFMSGREPMIAAGDMSELRICLERALGYLNSNVGTTA